MIERILTRIARWTVAHPWVVLGVAAILTVASAALLPRLEILTSRTALYPTDQDVNLRFQEFLDNFGTTNNLIAVVEGEPDTLGPFAEDLAAELRRETEVVSGLFYKADLEFFAERAFLFLSVDQMEKMRARVAGHEEELARFGRLNGLKPLFDSVSRVDADTGFSEGIDIRSAEQIITAATELFAEFEAWLTQPQRDELKVLENLFAQELAARDQDPEGYLRSHDRRLLFLFIQPTSNSDEFEFLHKLVTQSRAAVDRATQTWRDAGREPPTVGFAGLPAQADEETIAIRKDVVFTASVAAVAVLIIILVGFRSIRRGILVFIPLLLAGLWNMGLTALTVGHLTILTSGFTAILFGLGVDYGIFVSGRIAEELGRGLSTPDAIVAAVRTAGRTLVAAGTTTMLAFFVIGTVDFTGFAELGIVAGTGVILVMAATLFVLPALSTLVRLPPQRPRAAAANGNGNNLWRRPPLVFTAAITLVALLLGGLSLRAALKIPVDFDFRNIMPEDSESVHYQREMSQRSDFQPEFVAAIADDLDEARRLTRELAALPTVARVESITRVLPENQARKLAIVRELEPAIDKIRVARDDFVPFTGPELADRLDEMVDLVLDAQDRAFAAGQKELVVALEKLATRMEGVAEKLRTDPQAEQRARDFEAKLFGVLATGADLLHSWTRVGPLRPADLPEGIRDRFVGRDGRFAVYAFPAGSVYEMDSLDRFLDDIYEIAPRATGFPTTHQVFSRMIVTGFRQATAYAVVVVLLLLLLEFRRIGYALAAALPLVLGGMWMFGVLYVMDVSFNFANIIALPLVIGLAVDYGVYITHRLREDRMEHPFAVMERAAVPVLLAALTTLVGIGAICLGEHRGAASLGEALIYGIATCLTAALVVLPAAVATARRLARGNRKGEEK